MLEVSEKWVRRQIDAGVIQVSRRGGKKRGPFMLAEADVDTLRERLNAKPPKGERAEISAIARIEQLETDRANLLAQLAWARAIGQEQQKTIEAETERARWLDGQLAEQRARVEALKALSLFDRLLGRHKSI